MLIGTECVQITKQRVMKDWFLRGGERPKGKLPDPPDELPADDGEDFDDGVIACPHCGQSLYDDDDEEAD